MNLYPYQETGVTFLRSAKSSLMADEMGLGKTVQTIQTLEDEDWFPALIVAPNTVKYVWKSEFAQWAPNRTVVVAPNGTVAATKAIQDIVEERADVLVINWEALKNLSRLAGYGSIRLQTCSNCDPNSTRKPSQCEIEDKILNAVTWCTVVADEAHRAKGPKSKQTRALWALGDKTCHRIALTGTPISNTLEDLWSVMRFVAPEEYPAKWPLMNRYGILVPNIHSGGVDVVGMREDRREEFDRFFLPRFIRRLKAQVLPDLPPKTYERRDVLLTGKQKKAYDDLRDSMVAKIDGGHLASTSVLTQALRLRQLASAFAEVTEDEREKYQELNFDDLEKDSERVDAKLILAEPSSKLDALEEVLVELGDQPVVIFADSRQLIDLAFKRLENKYVCGRITGPTSPEERSTAVENFQAGRSRILLATTGAGGEGITLTAAKTAIFLQRPWSMVMNKQAEDRLHRIGQEAENVLYIDLVAKDTIEDRVFEALTTKGEKLEELVRDADTLKGWIR